MALNVVVLYSAGHLGSSMILNRLLAMPEYKVVGVVKAKPVQFSSQGLKKLRTHLIKTGWRFAWLMFLYCTVMILMLRRAKPSFMD